MPLNDMDEALRLHASGDLQAAETHYQRILAETPNHPQALHLLGVARHQRGDNERAVELIRAAVLNDSGQPPFFYNLAVILDEIGQRRRRGARTCRA